MATALSSDGGAAGCLAYSPVGGSLAFKKEGGSLIYKSAKSPSPSGGSTRISFAWGSDGSDLDICAYWDGAPDMKVGFDYAGAGTHVSGAYSIEYSGDKRGVGDTEWTTVMMNPWTAGPRTFSVHLNFYGYDSEAHPGDTCVVVASQQGGRTLVKTDVSCATNNHSKATTSDPKVTVEFDPKGNLIKIL